MVLVFFRSRIFIAVPNVDFNLTTHVSERSVLDLACGRHEGACLYRAGMDVEPCESNSIVHGEAPSMNAARPPSVWTPLLSA